MAKRQFEFGEVAAEDIDALATGDAGDVGDHCTGHCSSAAYELEEATCGTAADITLQNITPFIDKFRSASAPGGARRMAGEGEAGAYR